ncbi:MAG TPA: sulfurtransferase TusA family protein [Firmicutes bacterium]|nr:sulfurtransferase TusA family protein [Bacillota bacterium]
MTNVDARGLSCPEPLLMLKKAIKQDTEGKITLLLSSQNALNNCKRYAETNGYAVNVIGDNEDNYTLELTKG